jgi:hypothetical protein
MRRHSTQDCSPAQDIEHYEISRSTVNAEAA